MLVFLLPVCWLACDRSEFLESSVCIDRLGLCDNSWGFLYCELGFSFSTDTSESSFVLKSVSTRSVLVCCSVQIILAVVNPNKQRLIYDKANQIIFKGVTIPSSFTCEAIWVTSANFSGGAVSIKCLSFPDIKHNNIDMNKSWLKEKLACFRSIPIRVLIHSLESCDIFIQQPERTNREREKGPFALKYKWIQDSSYQSSAEWHRHIYSFSAMFSLMN